MKTLWLSAALFMLCLLHGSALAQTVYRCTDPSGQAVFQQAPCASGKGGAITVREANVVEGNPAGEAPLRAQAQRNQAVSLAQARGQVAAGMTTSEMQQVMGRAQVVNSDYFGNSERQQHVYRWPDGRTRYVYTQDGVLTGLQERPGYGAATAPRSGCDAEQVRDLRFRLGSATRTAEEKAAIRSRLESIEQHCR